MALLQARSHSSSAPRPTAAQAWELTGVSSRERRPTRRSGLHHRVPGPANLARPQVEVVDPFALEVGLTTRRLAQGRGPTAGRHVSSAGTGSTTIRPGISSRSDPRVQGAPGSMYSLEQNPYGWIRTRDG